MGSSQPADSQFPFDEVSLKVRPAGFDPEDLSTSLRELWTLPDDVRYLNHGSFGPSPRAVQQVREAWSAKLEQQPMQFFLREMEEALDEATDRLGRFLGTSGQHLAFVENATFGMNIVAGSVPLAAGDEVLLTGHEYGAVQRIWQNTCRAAGAQVVTCALPDYEPAANGGRESAADGFLQATVEAVAGSLTEHTRMIVVSHVTSPTARVLPVREICRLARGRNIPVCVDGPHAIAMLPVNLKELGCEYYVASCHKWLCGPFGSGFLYAAPRVQSQVKPAITSWGGSLSGRPFHWKDEFRWCGTYDPARFLAVPAAVEFLEFHGLEMFRKRSAALLDYAEQRISAVTGLPQPTLPDVARSPVMRTFRLPAAPEPPVSGGQRDPLQLALQERDRIEVPVINFQGQRLLRVSCHLYNTRAEIDFLADALEHALRQEQHQRAPRQ